MQHAVIAAQMGMLHVDYLLTSTDSVELLVGAVIVARAFEQHVEFVEAQRSNLAIEIINELGKALR